MERIIKFTKAFDRRDPDPKKNYGIEGAMMYMGLKGELGTAVLTVRTNWYTKSIEEEFMSKDGDFGNLRSFFTPRAVEIGYHSPKQMFEGQRLAGSTKIDWDNLEEHDLGDRKLTIPKIEHTDSFHPCEWLDNRPCYSDGSATHAEEYFNTLVEEGEDAFWKKMEDYYISTFGELR